MLSKGCRNTNCTTATSITKCEKSHNHKQEAKSTAKDNFKLTPSGEENQKSHQLDMKEDSHL